MKKSVLFLCVFVLVGCSTKNYGRQGIVTDYEKDSLSCRELDIEMAKAEGFVHHVNKESEFSGRDVLAILGDFGIGNALERDAALESARVRKEQLNELKSKKKCESPDGNEK